MQWKSDTAQEPEHAASLIGKMQASFANGLIIVLKPLKRFFALISRIRYGLSPKRWGSVQDLEAYVKQFLSRQSTPTKRPLKTRQYYQLQQESGRRPRRFHC